MLRALSPCGLGAAMSRALRRHDLCDASSSAMPRALRYRSPAGPRGPRRLELCGATGLATTSPAAPRAAVPQSLGRLDLCDATGFTSSRAPRRHDFRDASNSAAQEPCGAMISATPRAVRRRWPCDATRSATAPARRRHGPCDASSSATRRVLRRLGLWCRQAVGRLVQGALPTPLLCYAKEFGVATLPSTRWGSDA